MDAVNSINIDGCGYSEIAEEDLAEFLELRELSANENLLQMKPFGIIPQLKTLSLACNLISEVPQIQGRFQALEVVTSLVHHSGTHSDRPWIFPSTDCEAQLLGRWLCFQIFVY